MYPQNIEPWQREALNNWNAWRLKEDKLLTESEKSSTKAFSILVAERIKNTDPVSATFKKIVIESSMRMKDGARTTFLQIENSEYGDLQYIDTSNYTAQQLKLVFDCLKDVARVPADILVRIEGQCMIRNSSLEEESFFTDFQRVTKLNFPSLLARSTALDKQFFRAFSDRREMNLHVGKILDQNYFYNTGDATLWLAKACLRQGGLRDEATEALRSVLHMERGPMLEWSAATNNIIDQAKVLLGPLLFDINQNNEESDADFLKRKRATLKQGFNELIGFMHSEHGVKLEELFFKQLKAFSGLENMGDLEFPKELAEVHKTLNPQYFQIIMKLAEECYALRPPIASQDRDVKTASEVKTVAEITSIVSEDKDVEVRIVPRNRFWDTPPKNKKEEAQEEFDVLLEAVQRKEWIESWTEKEYVRKKIIVKFDQLLELAKKAGSDSCWRLATECRNNGLLKESMKAYESVLDSSRGFRPPHWDKALFMLTSLLSARTNKDNPTDLRTMIEDLYKIFTKYPLRQHMISKEVADIWAAHIAVFAGIDEFNVNTTDEYHFLPALLKKMAVILADAHSLRLPEPEHRQRPLLLSASATAVSAAAATPTAPPPTAAFQQPQTQTQIQKKPGRSCTLM